MRPDGHYNARIIASIAATTLSLACGTNYVYSAWAPQFAERLKLSATESNLIGLFGNLGMYTMGFPIGYFVDHRGPRPAVLGGILLLIIGYYPLHQAYDKAAGSVPLLCVFSYLSGLGGCMAFAAAVKTSALNWPHHRGTATAFPLAAFGLSAFFFSLLGSILFPGDPSDFLLLLSFGTSGLAFVSFFFLKVYPQTSTDYEAVPDLDDVDDVVAEQGGGMLRRTSSDEAKLHRFTLQADESNEPDIRGFALLRNLSFWQLFSIMAILAGIGIMTINNIGNDAKALWLHYDPTKDEEFLVGRQQMHVSILSVGSFLGRLSSGVGSDYLVKVLRVSRVWCLALACLIFLLAQICALNIVDPNHLFFVSGLSGLGYGFLFGVYPSIVAETFGIRGLSQNWGWMTLSPVISSNIFNLFYGSVYDKHSVVEPNGERACDEGLACYQAAYWVTFFACFGGIAVTLWTIRHQHMEHLRQSVKDEERD